MSKAIAILIVFVSVVSVDAAPGNSDGLVKDVAVRGDWQRALGIDEFLNQHFRSHPDTSYLDLATNTIFISGRIIFDKRSFSKDEMAKLRVLTETSHWVSADGRNYDLSGATMIFRDGTGGFGDLLTYLTSEEFSRIRQDPFAFHYPASPFVKGMSPGEYLEALIFSLGPDGYYIDGINGNIVVPSLALPLHNLDINFCYEVLAIVISPSEWTGPSGKAYDFRRTSIIYPISHIGTVEQRQLAAQKRKNLIDEIYRSLEGLDKSSVRAPFFLTLNEAPMTKQAGEIIGTVIHQMPFTSCANLLTGTSGD